MGSGRPDSISPKEVVVEVRRSGRFYTVGGHNDNLKRVWFVCHGYGHLASFFIRKFSVLDSEENMIVAPEALSRFYLSGFSGRVGASWMTKEDRLNEIDDYVSYLDTVSTQILSNLPGDLPLIILGFSQGTATAGRWIGLGKIEPAAVILWAGSLPPELKGEEQLQKFRKSKLIIVRGNDDEFATEEQIAAQCESLQQRQVPYRLIRFNGGHEIDSQVLGQIARDLS